MLCVELFVSSGGGSDVPDPVEEAFGEIAISVEQRATAHSFLDDLPERVLLDDLAVSERVEIATAHLDPLS